MGSLALLAKQLGHRVSGSDANVYPPMSTQLESLGIELSEGYLAEHLQPAPDLVIIGNAMSRGNPAVEYVLNEGLPYVSGPQWLAQHVLQGKWVLGVSGTHGKTTTSAMLAWILHYAKMDPGYLIGGVTQNFSQSANLGSTPFFVVEADEYDSAFFDKRSKFIHYAPRTAIVNNLEFDHADIFADLEAIETQFHHMVRTVPGNGLIISPWQDSNVEAMLARGCWSPRQVFGVNISAQDIQQQTSAGAVVWNADVEEASGQRFIVRKHEPERSEKDVKQGSVAWEMTGLHNVNNGVAAIAAAHHVGVDVATACSALSEFKGVKRRLEHLGTVRGVEVYDDFAHHPTAIATTLAGMRARMTNDGATGQLIAVIEPRSNTMKLGVHQEQLSAACQEADQVIWFKPEDSGLDFSALLDSTASDSVASYAFATVADITQYLVRVSSPGDRIVIMSNGGFGGIHQQLLQALGQ
jgi:UDP-N-acetylmuramate: L-alanyl-gamma-D-glutamyl-meso-diaminopimelate ligase